MGDTESQSDSNDDSSTATGTTYSDEELLDYLRQCHEEYDKVTVSNYWAFYREHDVPSPSTITNRLGSWIEAKERAGVGSDGRSDNGRPRQFSTTECIAAIQELKCRHGRASQDLIDREENDDLPSSGTIVDRFGTWTQAKKEADVDDSIPEEQRVDTTGRYGGRYDDM